MAPAAGVLIVGLLLTDRTGICLSSLLAASVHELGHVFAARMLKVPLKCLRFDLLGARLDALGRMVSYGEEWLLCVAGPLFSFCFSSVIFLFPGSDFWIMTATASFVFGLLNLLPIRSFDGGRMLFCSLSYFAGEKIAEKTLSFFSFLCLFFLWGIAVYCLLKIGDGLSLFCFSMSLFSRFFEGDNS